jgi:hypothetical protein
MREWENLWMNSIMKIKLPYTSVGQQEESIIKVNSKIKIFSKLWDEKAQRVKKQHPLSLEINHRLTQLKADIEKSVLTLIARNPDYMADDVKDLVEQLVNGKINHSQQITFWSAFDMYISEKRKLCKEGTVKKIFTTYNLLIRIPKVTLHFDF